MKTRYERLSADNEKAYRSVTIYFINFLTRSQTIDKLKVFKPVTLSEIDGIRNET